MKKTIILLMGLILFSLPLEAASVTKNESYTAPSQKIVKPIEKIKFMTLNGESLQIPESLIEVNGQILFPFSWLAENMGATNIHWNEKTVTVEVPAYFEEHLYLSYLNGLTNEKENVDFSLPERLKNLSLPPYPLNGENFNMIYQEPITLIVKDKAYSMPFAFYDYDFYNEKLYVTSDWFNTLFLAQTEIKQDAVTMTYLDKAELEIKLKDLESLVAPITPEETLTLWVRGQQVRSGALQYSSLSPNLKRKVVRGNRGWVTGGSSPSAGKVSIIKKEKVGQDVVRYELKINQMLQGKVSGETFEMIEIKKYIIDGKEYWLISKACGDLGLFSILPDKRCK